MNTKYEFVEGDEMVELVETAVPFDEPTQRKAERIIENERVIRMSAQTAAWFFDLINNQPPPIPMLANAFKRYNARKVSSEGSNSTFEF